MKVYGFIKNFLLSGENERSAKAKRNIIGAFVIKVITVLSTFITYPIVINYLNPTRYGIFLTLSSIIAWMLLLDVGFGSGLKNKLTEAKARGEILLARKYVSTTYVALAIILIFIILIFLSINPIIPWGKVLNTLSESDNELKYLVLIVFSSACLSFLLRLIISVISADQKPAKVSLIDMIGQLLSLAGLLILIRTTESSLLYAASIICFTPVLVYFITSLFLYKTTYNDIRPSLRFVDFKLTKSLMGLGIKFFVATISALILFQTTNVLISYFVGPTDVTLFNVAYKLFGVGYTAMLIITNPYWAAYSDAYTLQDYDWMRKSFKRLKQVFLWSLVVEVLFLVFSRLIFRIWMGNAIDIPFPIIATVFIYSNLMSWLSVCILPINGIGKVKLQLYSSLGELIAIGPVAIFMAYVWGTSGIILAPVIVSLPRAIWAPIQLNKLINNKATGIWSK